MVSEPAVFNFVIPNDFTLTSSCATLVVPKSTITFSEVNAEVELGKAFPVT